MPSVLPPPDSWVIAAPFRYHVRQLVATTGVPWPVVAFVADVPLAQVQTLLFGRGGQLRPRMSPYAARRLLRVNEPVLLALRATPAPASYVAEGIRQLLADGMAAGHLAAWLGIDAEALERLAQARCHVTRVTEILVTVACRRRGLVAETDSRAAA